MFRFAQHDEEIIPPLTPPTEEGNNAMLNCFVIVESNRKSSGSTSHLLWIKEAKIPSYKAVCFCILKPKKYSIKFFVGYLSQYQHFYHKLREIGYEVKFKNAMILPDGTTKGNVDIDIAISLLIDYYENSLEKGYLVSSDGDYNTLVEWMKKKGILGRVLIPSRESASVLLKRAAGADIQSLQDLQYHLEKEKS